MSYNGDLEKVKQIFKCVTHENISVEEMGVQNSGLDEEQRPKLVDAICDLDRTLKEANTIDSGSSSNDFVPEDDFGSDDDVSDVEYLDFQPEHEPKMFYSPLTSAARGGHAHVCEYLVKEQYANLEAIPSTPLIIAAIYNHTAVIKLLLQHNANVRAYDQDTYGHAAYYAAGAGNLDALKMLVEVDGNVINLAGENGEPPLLAAAGGGYVDICKYMVEEKNANVNATCPLGDTALERAYDPEIIRILKNNGAKDAWG